MKKKEMEDCAYDELLNKIVITVLEYAWGSKKCIKMLTDSKTNIFDENNLEAHLMHLIILEARNKLVEACPEGWKI